MSLLYDDTYIVSIHLFKGSGTGQLQIPVEFLGLSPAQARQQRVRPASIAIFPELSTGYNRLSNSRHRLQQAYMITTESCWFLPAARLPELQQGITDMQTQRQEILDGLRANHEVNRLEARRRITETIQAQQLRITDRESLPNVEDFVEKAMLRFPTIQKLEIGFRIEVYLFPIRGVHNQAMDILRQDSDQILSTEEQRANLARIELINQSNVTLQESLLSAIEERRAAIALEVQNALDILAANNRTLKGRALSLWQEVNSRLRTLAFFDDSLNGLSESFNLLFLGHGLDRTYDTFIQQTTDHLNALSSAVQAPRTDLDGMILSPDDEFGDEWEQEGPFEMSQPSIGQDDLVETEETEETGIEPGADFVKFEVIEGL